MNGRDHRSYIVDHNGCNTLLELVALCPPDLHCVLCQYDSGTTDSVIPFSTAAMSRRFEKSA